jgi:hypothetical protein
MERYGKDRTLEFINTVNNYLQKKHLPTSCIWKIIINFSEFLDSALCLYYLDKLYQHDASNACYYSQAYGMDLKIDKKFNCDLTVEYLARKNKIKTFKSLHNHLIKEHIIRNSLEMTPIILSKTKVAIAHNSFRLALTNKHEELACYLLTDLTPEDFKKLVHENCAGGMNGIQFAKQNCPIVFNFIKKELSTNLIEYYRNPKSNYLLGAACFDPYLGTRYFYLNITDLNNDDLRDLELLTMVLPILKKIFKNSAFEVSSKLEHINGGPSCFQIQRKDKKNFNEHESIKIVKLIDSSEMIGLTSQGQDFLKEASIHFKYYEPFEIAAAIFSAGFYVLLKEYVADPTNNSETIDWTKVCFFILLHLGTGGLAGILAGITLAVRQSECINNFFP